MGIKFNSTIEKYGQNGDKTGWTFITIPTSEATKLNPLVKTSFAVKGFLDKVHISQVTILPIGQGNFILPLNAPLRKKLSKTKGESVLVTLEIDKEPYRMNALLIECLNDDLVALRLFNTYTPSHQRYFSKWIDAAKTDETKAKRIAQTLNALHLNQNYGEMIRSLKKM